MNIAFIPSFILLYLGVKPQHKFEYNILFSNVILIAIILLLSHWSELFDIIPSTCLIKNILDIDCPGCGITRGLLYVSQGEFLTSNIYNQASKYVFLYLIIQMVLAISLIYNKRYFNLIHKLLAIGGKICVFIIMFVWIIKII